MRTSLYLIGFATASIVGAGAVGFGCSSSSTSPPAVDAGPAAETGPVEDGGEEGGGEDATADAPVTCMPGAISNVETVDGGPNWTCYQTMCNSALTACAADNCCNSGISAALVCAASAGTDQTKVTTCFTTAFTTDPIATNTAGMAVESCVVSMMAACPATTTGDAGPSDAGDGGSDAAPDTGISDAGDGGG